MKTLKTYMAEHDLSNTDVSKAVGSTIQAVSKWRNKKAIPSPDMMAKIKAFTNNEVTADSFY